MTDSRRSEFGTIISVIERGVIVIIIALTVIAVLFEIFAIWEQRSVTIADILLLFLYTEVLSMAGAFYTSRQIPTVYPLLIAITALSRLIVLQSKEMEPSAILYEASAIVILSVAVALLYRFGGERRLGDEPTDGADRARDGD